MSTFTGIWQRRRVEHYLTGRFASLLPGRSYLLRDYRLVVSVTIPGSVQDLTQLDALVLARENLRATLHAARKQREHDARNDRFPDPAWALTGFR